MGRVKLPMKFVEDKKRRNAMHRRRIRGLKKKAFELSTLCGVSVLLVSFGIDGQIDTWPEDRNEALGIANRFLQLKDEDQRWHETSLSDSLPLKIRTTEADLSLEKSGQQSAEIPIMNTTSSISGELDLQFDDISGGNIAFGGEYSQPERAMDHFPEQPFNTPLSTDLGIFGDLEMQFENGLGGTFAIGENFSEPSIGHSLGENETPLSTTPDIFRDLELQFDGNFGGPFSSLFSPLNAAGCHSSGF
ncbi:hypothetical protein J5N97_006552 [Dioscorea zingiberensis]|uniref:MADS-box domain-containing protein n=1 Tax=Dioscorea zingiberensis TaxID=325984 RepID=A0A9D5DAG9_9LILI|nr:hypothetical protein J5N97_006552 [Dioscorea zingiberensis]